MKEEDKYKEDDLIALDSKKLIEDLNLETNENNHISTTMENGISIEIPDDKLKIFDNN